MKTTLSLAVLVLASCGEKRDETKVAFALNAVELAAWQAAVDRASADRDDASAADGVDYSQALAALKAAEDAAAGREASADEISARRKTGEREGKKFAASLRVPD